MKNNFQTENKLSQLLVCVFLTGNFRSNWLEFSDFFHLQTKKINTSDFENFIDAPFFKCPLQRVKFYQGLFVNISAI